jgi:hypothetical protein
MKNAMGVYPRGDGLTDGDITYSAPPTIGIKNTWSLTSLPPEFYDVMHQDKFTFTSLARTFVSPKMFNVAIWMVDWPNASHLSPRNLSQKYL